MIEGISLGQLEAFLETTRLGNVTRAADSLFITQPALSARLKRLEQELGGPLLIRDHKGARLTEAGRAFLPHAERTLELMSQACEAVKTAQHGAGATLRVAATQTMHTYVLPSVIVRFVTKLPHVALSVRTAPSEEILQSVLTGDVDIGLCRSLQHPEVVSSPLFEEEYVFAVGRKHPFADTPEIDVQLLQDEVIFSLFRSSAYRLYLAAIMRRSGRVFQTTTDLDNAETAKRILAESIGVALLPRTAIRSEIDDGRLRQVKLRDVPPLHRTMVTLQRRDAAERDPIDEFSALLTGTLVRLGLN